MTKGNESPSPQDAEACADLGREEQVYDYYNAVLAGDEAREFETHLLDCFTCRRKLATLDWVHATVKDELMSAAASPVPEVRAEEATAPVDAYVAPVTVEEPFPTFYVVVGGLGVLGVLTLVGYKLIGYTRQRYAQRVNVKGQAVG
jgi:hypothetical protein